MTAKISPKKCGSKGTTENSQEIATHHITSQHVDREKPLRSTRRIDMTDQNFSVVAERITVECKTLVNKKHKVNSDLCKLIQGLLNGKTVDDAIGEWNKVLCEVSRVIRTDKRFQKNTGSLKRVTKRFTARVTNVLRFTTEETITIPATWKALIVLTDKIKSNPSRGKWDTKTGGFIKEGTQRNPTTTTTETPTTTTETTTSTLDNGTDDVDREEPVTISETTEETSPEIDEVIALKGKEVAMLLEQFKAMTKEEASRWATRFSSQITASQLPMPDVTAVAS